MFHTRLLLFIFIFLPQFLVAQTSFRQTYTNSNPVEKLAELTNEEKLASHEAFYQEARSEKNTLKEFCGLLYLTQDCLDAQDYISASKWILLAKDVALESKNPEWQGWMFYRKGVLNLRLREYEKSLGFYYDAAEACGKGKDSLCYAESIEQASVLNALLENYTEAEILHNQAMPLLKRFGDKGQEAKALNNLGIIFSLRGDHTKAIPYLNDAITIFRETDKKIELSKGLNNLANAYEGIGQIQKSEEILIDLIAFNKANNLTENLPSNYKNLSDVYELKNDYKTAKEYIILHYELSDSLVGIKAQNRINELDIIHNTDKQKATIIAKENELKLAENKILIRTLLIGFLLLTAFAAIALWIKNNKTKRAILEKNRTALKTMTNLLKTSASHVQSLEERLLLLTSQADQDVAESEFDSNLFNETILTQDDWLQFKIHYDSAYPGYIKRLRSVHPELSEAEERLFLFIKLKLSSKEAASILGISVDGIKKTRNRLRKRLKLEIKTDLREFVDSF